MRRPTGITIRRIAKNVMQGQSGADRRAMEGQFTAEAQRTPRGRRGGDKGTRRGGDKETKNSNLLVSAFPLLLFSLSPCLLVCLSPSLRSLRVPSASAVKAALCFSRAPIKISAPAVI